MQNIMGLFWITMSAWALVLFTFVVVLSQKGYTGVSQSLLWVTGAAFLALALNAKPFELFKMIWRRIRRTIHLQKPMDLRTASDQTTKVFLDDTGSSVILSIGDVVHHGKTLDLSEIKTVELYTLGNTRFTDRALEDFSLRLWTTPKPTQETLPKFQIEIACHPLMVPMLYWALWKLCQKRDLSLRSPSGTWSASELAKPFNERLQAPLHWARDNFSQAQDTSVPFLVSTEAGESRYIFPLHSAKGIKDVMEQGEQSRFDDLRFLSWLSMLGVVTAPLGMVSHVLSNKPGASQEVVIELRGDQIIIDGHAEPITDIVMISILPVHPGAPVLLTRTRAVLLGGLAEYEERVACGLHMLQAIHRALPDDQQERQLRDETPPVYTTQPPHKPWRPNLSSGSSMVGRAVTILFLLMTLGASVFAWIPWSRFHAHAPTLSPQLTPNHIIVLGLAVATFFMLLPILGSRKRLRFLVASPVIISMVMAPTVILPWVLPTSTHLPEADFANVDLANLSLEKLDMSKANFALARISHVSMTEATLDKANFQSADLSHVTMKNIGANEVDFTEATLYEVVLDSATLQSSNFSKAVLTGVNAKEAWMVDSFMTEGKWSGFDFSGADLSGADMSMTHMTGGFLSRTSLLSAKLHNVTMTRVTLTGARVEGHKGDQRAELCKVTMDEDSICANGLRRGTRSIPDCFGFSDPEKVMKDNPYCF